MDTVAAGSYDRFLFGFQCSTSGRTEEKLARSFTYPAHKGPIKCIAASAPYLVSGGADDLIHLYDLQSDVDLGFLMSPGDGAVSALAFHATDRSRHPSHMLSGSADGSLSVWQAGGEWVCLKTFQGHKKEVSSISVHPSGRVALSASGDGTLRLWNLVKGKCAHESTLKVAAETVIFSPFGTSYAVVQGQEILLQDVGQTPKAVLPHPRRALCMAFPSENAILSGSEEGAVQLWDPRTASKPVAVIPHAHKTRVKDIAPLSSSIADQAAGVTASASSDGVVKLWDFRKVVIDSKGVPTPIAKAATGARLTCLASLDPFSASAKAHTQQVHSQKATAAKVADNAPLSNAAKTSPAPKAKKAKMILSPDGIAQNGVVEFPEEQPPEGQAKKRKGKTGLDTNLSKRKPQMRLNAQNATPAVIKSQRRRQT